MYYHCHYDRYYQDRYGKVPNPPTPKTILISDPSHLLPDPSLSPLSPSFSMTDLQCSAVLTKQSRA